MPASSFQGENRSTAKRTVPILLLIEGLAFIAAALTHFGVLFHGFEHQRAGTAESVIGIVLLTGFALVCLRPTSGRTVSLAVQGFALLGTLVGIFTIAIGVGPRTVPDIVYHLVIVTVLVSGLISAVKANYPA